jgi:hypothetical protein
MNSIHQSFHQEQEVPSSLSKSFVSNCRRPYDSYDETTNLSSKYLTDGNSNVSSPYIRRTPYARRSLPHHIQPVPRKSSHTKSPNPFKIIKEQHLRHIVLAEPSIPPAVIPSKAKLERHFSDLSLNQIENDSLSPSTPHLLIHSRPSLSCSSSASSSTTNSSTDDSTTPFIHIQMNNQRGGRIPVIYASSNINNNKNSNTQSTKATSSFIQNVSITV